MTNENIKFRFYLIRAGLRESTVKTILKSFTMLQTNGGFAFSSIDKQIVSLREKDRSNNYINNLVKVVRHYGRFTNNKKLSEYPFIYKNNSRARAIMSDEEIEAFLAVRAIKENQQKFWDMWTLFFGTLAYTGMRPGELANMTVDRVDLGRGVFVLNPENTKTNDARLVPIPPNLSDEITRAVKTAGKYLFTTKYHRPPAPPAWLSHFRHRIQRLGLKRPNLVPYSLRHSFITRLLEEDVSFPKIMKIVGHKNPKTTLEYEHLTTKDIQRAIKKHPVIRRSTDPHFIIANYCEMTEAFEFFKDKRFRFDMIRENDGVKVSVRIKPPV
ncbi:site-specific integrase [Candidatus Collierbacteria bacterium]|nr:site-specific integrase [Candidatus Collierbacteria bacterium]